MTLQNIKHAASLMVVACAFAFFSSGCSHGVGPVSNRIFPTTAPYTISSSDPRVGLVHNAFLSYFFDSIVPTSTFISESQGTQGARIQSLMTRFMLDSTDIDTSGTTNISSLYQNAGNYMYSAWVKETADSIITLLSLAHDEDSTCRALIDTMFESNYATRTSSLNSMQSQWLTKWTNIDGSGTNGTHDYVLGGMLSIAVSSNALVATGIGSSGEQPCGILAALADIAGFGVGYATGSSGTWGRIVNGFKVGSAASAFVAGHGG